MSLKPLQIAGRPLRDDGSDGELRSDSPLTSHSPQKFAGNGSPASESSFPRPRRRRTLQSSRTYIDVSVQEFFSIPDLAARWRVSRSAVYGYLRGYPVIDFAPAPGRKGHKLVSAEVVLQIERERMRVMR